MLAACTPASEPEPEPTETALFSSDEEAFAAAEETYREYLAVYNAIDLADGSALDATRDYVTGRYAASERESISRLQAEELSRHGASKLVSFEGQSYERPDRINARICSDVSETDIVDVNGKSVVSPTRPDRYALDVTFIIDGEAILLAESQAVEDESCASAES